MMQVDAESALHQLSPHTIIVAANQQLGIFLGIFNVLFSVSPKKGALQYCKVMIFRRLTSIIVVHNKREIISIDYIHSKL